MQSNELNPTKSSRVLVAVRVLGALLILFVGADHYWEYSADQYSVLPTIGTLFLLNFISATVVGVILLAPLKRIFHRFGRVVLGMAALSGVGIAATSLVALLVSEHTPLFGFMESNYRPAILIAIASEAAAAASLALLLALTVRATKRSVTKSSGEPAVEHSQPAATTTMSSAATSSSTTVATGRRLEAPVAAYRNSGEPVPTPLRRLRSRGASSFPPRRPNPRETVTGDTRV